MKSAYHCSKKGNNDRLLLIPEEFRDDIRDFVESESKGWWRIRKTEVVPETGTCDWFNPNTTTNGDADDEAEQTMMEGDGEADGEENLSPLPYEYPPDIEIKHEPLEYSELPDHHDEQVNNEEVEDDGQTPGPSSMSPSQQITFPMASVSIEYKKTKRKRKDINYEQTPDMMQQHEKTEEDAEGGKFFSDFSTCFIKKIKIPGAGESFPRSYQKKFLKFTNRCLNVEKTVQQEFLKQQWQLMQHEHKLQAERDQMIIDSFQRATNEILEMSRTMLQNVFYNHSDDHLDK